MSGRPPPALLALAAPEPPGVTAAEQQHQPSSSNETQDTAGQLEQIPSVVQSQKKPSILKSAYSLKGNYGDKRNITWQDQFGRSLTEVVEFEPRYVGTLSASSRPC